MQMLRKYPEHCTILGTIPQASVTYHRQDLWIGNNASSPAPEWDLEIIVIWNKEAQHMLFDQNPRWCVALSNAIPEAILQPCPHPPTQNAAKFMTSLRRTHWQFGLQKSQAYISSMSGSVFQGSRP